MTVDWRVEVRYELAEEADSVTEIKEAVSKLVPAGTPIIINPPEDEQGGASAAGDMKSPLPPPGAYQVPVNDCQRQGDSAH